jgi:GNAT superfamily N-acetyltransferase
MMIELVRTDSTDQNFKELILLLDNELNDQYGDKQNYYDRFNIIEECKTVVIAKSNNNPIGCGCFKTLTDDTVEIKRMFVNKNSRRQGISKKILTELETWAIELGYDFALLETGYKQKEAIGLYEKYGYRKTDNYGPYIGIETSICMKKKFSD